MHLNDLKLNKTYYEVKVGRISKITVLDINVPKFKIKYIDPECQFEDETFLSDCGIRFDGENYVNNLNSIFETEAEAEAFIGTEYYKEKLQKHFEVCSYYDDYDDYDDYYEYLD